MLSGAKNINQETLRSMILHCTNLKTVVFKQVSSDIMTIINDVKQEFIACNFEIDIITYGHRPVIPRP